MRNYLIAVFIPITLLSLNPRGEENIIQKRLQREKEFIKLRGPSANDEVREKYIDIDSKKVNFPHRMHQNLIKEIGKSCNICHHPRKEGQAPRACRKCHARQRVVSQGKYAQAGKKLNQKDIFHLLCGDCHKKMFLDGYRRVDGSSSSIPIKCHHCHLKKGK